MVEALVMLYVGSPYEQELNEVRGELMNHQSMLARMVKIKENLVKVSDNLLSKISEMQELVTARETERTGYDHYRNKVAKMEQPGGDSTSGDATAQERYSRNQAKLDKARATFETQTQKLEFLLEKAEEKLEKVLTDLTLRFAKEV